MRSDNVSVSLEIAEAVDVALLNDSAYFIAPPTPSKLLNSLPVNVPLTTAFGLAVFNCVIVRLFILTSTSFLIVQHICSTQRVVGRSWS